MVFRPEIAKREKRTVDDFAQDIFECMVGVGYDKGTLKNYETVYNQSASYTFKNTDIRKSTKKDIKESYDSLNGMGYVYEYRVIGRTIFNHIFNYAIELGYIAENPCDDIRVEM